MIRLNGSRLLVELLVELGIEVIFGVPGSESVEFLDELRRRQLRFVLSTSEREAVFMAIGHYAASGRIAASCSIGGPGFTNALTGIAEAREDSAALLHILICRDVSGDEYGLHAIDHRALATPLAKAYFFVEETSSLEETVRAAHERAMAGEPGPIVIHFTRRSLIGSAGRTARTNVPPGLVGIESNVLFDRLQTSTRPVFIAGQGALDASVNLTKLVETMQCPLLTTGSGRGVLPDRHPLAFGTSIGQEEPSEVAEQILEASDLIVALGCKFTHNGSFAHRLNLPENKLARVDASAFVLAANYPASISLVADVPSLVERMCEKSQDTGPKKWETGALQALRERADEERRSLSIRDRVLRTTGGSSPATVFGKLRDALPDNARLVTDSGLHQFLARAHFEVLRPRTLLFPADFQSMGYGIPAAIGAQLATSDAATVAVVGDGGFAMTALEMATARREGIPIKVLVIRNGTLELIREAQLRKRGVEHSIRLLSPNLKLFADSLELPFARWDDLDSAGLRALIERDSPVLIEVEMVGTRPPWPSRIEGRTRGVVERRLSPELVREIKQRRNRRRR